MDQADTSTQPTNKKTSKKPLIVTLTLLLVGLMGASYWYSYGQYFESTDNAYLAGDITSISSKVVGFVNKSYVIDNQRVKEGDLLVEIDNQDFQTALSQANAHLRVVESDVETLIAQQTMQFTKISQAQSHVDSSAAEYDRANQQVVRFRSLLEKKYTSQDDVDKMQVQQRIAVANLDEAKASLSASNNQLAVIASEINHAKASVAEAKAQQQQAQLNLGYTKIYAPIDGIIGKRSVREGMLVQIGTPFISIVSEGTVWVDANFKETQIGKIHTGQMVELEFDAYPEQTVKGMVDSFSPATGAKFSLIPSENATGNFTKVVQRVPVKIVIVEQNAENIQLLPGLSVVATIDTRG